MSVILQEWIHYNVKICVCLCVCVEFRTFERGVGVLKVGNQFVLMKSNLLCLCVQGQSHKIFTYLPFYIEVYYKSKIVTNITNKNQITLQTLFCTKVNFKISQPSFILHSHLGVLENRVKTCRVEDIFSRKKPFCQVD